MRAGGHGGKATCVDLSLNPGMVRAELLQTPGTESVQPAIADMPEAEPTIRRDQAGSERCPHPAGSRTLDAGADYLLLRSEKPLAQHIAKISLPLPSVGRAGEDLSRGFRGKRARDLSRRVPTHPIRDQEDATVRIDEERVLISFADTTDVTCSRRLPANLHGPPGSTEGSRRAVAGVGEGVGVHTQPRKKMASARRSNTTKITHTGRRNPER